MDFIQPSDLSPDSGLRTSIRSATDHRGDPRHPAACELFVSWHGEFGTPHTYPAIDISENGARIEVDCLVPEGLTGNILSRHVSGFRIDRPAMVVWCRVVRDNHGIPRHYEAGIRFF